AREHLDGAIVELHGEVHDDLAVGAGQDLAYTGVEAHGVGGPFELVHDDLVHARALDSGRSAGCGHDVGRCVIGQHRSGGAAVTMAGACGWRATRVGP